MTGTPKDVIKQCFLLSAAKLPLKMQTFPKNYYQDAMVFYANTIEQLEKTRFGRLSTIYSRAQFIEARAIRGASNIEKIGALSIGRARPPLKRPSESLIQKRQKMYCCCLALQPLDRMCGGQEAGPATSHFVTVPFSSAPYRVPLPTNLGQVFLPSLPHW